MQLGGAQQSARRDTARRGDALPAGRWDARAQPGEKGLAETGAAAVRMGDAGPSELRVARCDAGTGGEMLFSMVHGQLAPVPRCVLLLLAYLAQHLSW